MRRLLLVLPLVASSCYLADDTGRCVTPTEDRVFVDDGELAAGLYCFDDGDGYPTFYPPVTTAHYPTVSP